MAEQPNALSPFVPERHPEQDLFLCDVTDAVFKDIIPQMEHPFFTLSKKPAMETRMYRNGDLYVEVSPNMGAGLPTIYDKDILIYCVSQIMHKLDRGEPVSKRVKIVAHDLLVFANRGAGGEAYNKLEESLARLAGAMIKTNVETGDEEETRVFHLIEYGGVRRKKTSDGSRGRVLWCEIELSDWIFKAIEAKEVLTLHRDYFRLRKPTERRIYEIARKHCGRQPKWKISLEKLHNKSGSLARGPKFKEMIRALVKSNHLPDYEVSLDPDDMVIFHNRDTMPGLAGEDIEVGKLPSEAYEMAREVCPKWDIFFVESEWRVWMEGGGMEPPENPTKAFVGFARAFYKRKGAPN